MNRRVAPASPEDLARTRFFVLVALRLGGLAAMILGAWIWRGSIARPGGLPEAGMPIFAVGAVLALLLPHLLRRRWRTPDL